MKPEPSGWTLSRVWDALKKLWLLIVVAGVVGGGVGFAISASITPIFQSTATLFFSLNQGTSGSDLNQGSAYAQSQMLSFAQLATSSLVLEPVIDELNLDTTPRKLAQSIEVTVPLNTVLLGIQASSTQPEMAADIANEIAESLTKVVAEVSPAASTGSDPSITARLVDEAVPPQFQALPNKSRDAVLGIVVGLILGVFAALLWTLLDTRIPNESTLTHVVAAPVLGSVTRVRKGAGGLFVLREPLGTRSDEFRRIRSALSYASVNERVQRLLVTSVVPGEGKSTFTANFALTLAGLRHTVLVIDADLRRPRIAEYFQVEGAVGLTSVLLGEATFEDAKISRPGTTVDILPSGAIPPNPAEMLTSDAMRRLMEEVSDRYDYVIVDSPPVLSVADANLLTPLVDGTIVIVNASKTRRTQLAHAVASFEAAGGRIVGVVLNKVRRRHSSAYYEDAAVAEAS